ncbi:thiol reductant ABC exporter subunit CydC [Philodulcilactobacillus myokoensis]|uniref:Thiol reductant ABC exporter subunit CydC n=1 Tax=Philodulcilactobacillus myokoensis TaxID=2929573 RepID=A0A9W6AZZ0_9LACO|nr:thiol reductant ABC exporter subunit CydC [Philodulcilactobacillus myokoensis]GLB46065.1 thiol reductant ABC exporter subunit CydC [Philodulcilactobacillus myokoensis]
MFKFLKHDKWIRPFLKKDRKRLLITFSLGMLTSISAIGLMFVAGYLISRSATRPANILIVYVPIILAQAFGIGRPLFKYLERIKSHDWVLGVTSKLRSSLYRILEKQAFFLDEKYQFGSLLDLLADDIDHLENLYLKTIFPTLIANITGLIVIIGLGIINWVMALIMLGFFIMILFLMPWLSIVLYGKLQTNKKQLTNQAYNHTTDTTLGITDWMISGRQKDYLKRNLEFDRQISIDDHQLNHFEWNRDLITKIILDLVIVIVLVWGNLNFIGSQSAANYIAAFVLGIFPLIDILVPVSQAVEEWPMYRRSLVHLNQLSQNEPKIKRVPNSDLSPAQFQKITMKNVSFHYSNDTQTILRNISIQIKKGSKLAIIGPSGVGKSTLLQLFLGIINPTSGNVQINDTDVNQLKFKYQKWFSVLSQQPFLFNTSILNNVRIGNENASDQEVKQALKDVRLDHFIHTLPDGYQTNIQESGARLSGGQKQRLSLARILLQNHPIVILDEPTVGLDPLTENQLIETLTQVLKHKTVIWVTHHLQGLSKMDQVIFLKNGNIQMAGSPKELSHHNAHYRRLAAMDKGLVK